MCASGVEFYCCLALYLGGFYPSPDCVRICLVRVASHFLFSLVTYACRSFKKEKTSEFITYYDFLRAGAALGGWNLAAFPRQRRSPRWPGRRGSCGRGCWHRPGPWAAPCAPRSPSAPASPASTASSGASSCTAATWRAPASAGGEVTRDLWAWRDNKQAEQNPPSLMLLGLEVRFGQNLY